MPQQVLSTVENHFTKGLITEFTGLNFPEDAATDSDNTEYTIIGDVLRREGIDIETNGIAQPLTRTNLAISTYKWDNAGGDGLTQVVVKQVGGTLYFYQSSNATNFSPLSKTLLSPTVTISSFVASGGSFNATLECQFATGNGYLFVFHPSCDPFYCTYNNGAISGTLIIVQIRDFAGVTDPLLITTRPATLSAEHQYNITNQGWVKGSPWSATSLQTKTAQVGTVTFTDVAAALTVTVGDKVSCLSGADAFPGGVFQPAGSLIMRGDVTGYAGTSLTINIVAVSSYWLSAAFSSWVFSPTSTGYVDTFKSATGVYPSNSDVWWAFKNASGSFDPTTTINNVTLNTGGGAPKGHFILPAFSQQRSFLSGIAGLTDITTTIRPKTGTWFQGRIWYAGVDAQQAKIGDAPFYTWSESIYFSQIVIDTTDFGNCFQVNDPTSATLFSLLPTDGGVITIPGSGSIYKLFPLQNAMLIFAANGVWYLTGSSGIGFAANDYTIVKLSSVRSISSTSFVDVQGLPMFWNEEGIYSVEAAKQGTSLLNTPLHVNPLEVIPITLGTILSFYNDIPLSSKKYARGIYDPIEYVVKWIYRDTEATDTTGKYTFNKILNFNNANKAFFPYTIDTTLASINSIIYVVGPGGFGSPLPIVKYVCSTGSNIYFGDEHDTTFKDWVSQGGTNYISTFTTGYKLHGQGQRRFQIPYLYLYNRTNSPVSYKIQSLWDYANDRNSNRWSIAQITNINNTLFNMTERRHRLRGYGLVLQIKVSSVDGQPFDVIGWSVYETANQGV